MLKTLKDTCIAYLKLFQVEVLSRMGAIKKKSSKEMLMLAWLFPPRVAGGVYRPLAMVSCLSESGWRVNVVAGQYDGDISPAGQYLVDKIERDVVVNRVVDNKSTPSYSLFPRIDGNFITALDTFFYVKKLYKESHPSVIFATGPLFHNFVAAYYLARYFNVKLVLEYRDEWSNSPFDFIQHGNSDRSWEAKCGDAADLIVFTTQSQLKKHVHSFDIDNIEKYKVVPNGWDENDWNDNLTLNGQEKLDVFFPTKASKIRIVFLGNLSSHTDPGDFLSFLEELFNYNTELSSLFEIYFIGQKSTKAISQLDEFIFSENIKQLDQVTKPEAFEIMRRADALLIFSPSNMDRYLPGKLYDYLASKKKIICYGEGGEIFDLVKKLNAGYVVPLGDSYAFIRAITALSQKRGADNKALDDWLVSHTRVETSKLLLRYIEEL